MGEWAPRTSGPHKHLEKNRCRPKVAEVNKDNEHCPKLPGLVEDPPGHHHPPVLPPGGKRLGKQDRKGDDWYLIPEI